MTNTALMYSSHPNLRYQIQYVIFSTLPPHYYKMQFPLTHQGQTSLILQQRKTEWKSIATEDFLVSLYCFTTVLSVASPLRSVAGVELTAAVLGKSACTSVCST